MRIINRAIIWWENWIRSNIFYKGNYLNGKFHGYGKEFNNKYRLLFKGYYENGERSSGQEYNRKGAVKFDGVYKNGKKSSGDEYIRYNEYVGFKIY